MFAHRSVLRGPKTRARAQAALRADRHSPHRGSRLHVESLEDRRLLSVTASLLWDIGIADNLHSGGSAELDGTLIFSSNIFAEDVAEIWKTDGTESGTVLVKTLPDGDTAQEFTNVGGTIFFTARNSGELWKTDGTEDGTEMVLALSSSQGRNYLTDLNGTLYFRTKDALWKSDGTQPGTVLVKSLTNARDLAVVGGTLFFSTFSGANPTALWKSDGTTAGTVMVKQFSPGSFSFGPITNVNGVAYFAANDGTHGKELWKSDGTEAGTVMVKDIFAGSGNANPRNLTSVGSEIFFAADDGTHGDELWKTDGTEEGTVLVKDISTGSHGSINPTASSNNPFVNFAGNLLFRANNGTNGYELWKSDGTEAGTVLVKDINPGDGSSNSFGELIGNFDDPLTVFGSEVYFAADDGTHGPELWKTDGTAAGTFMVKDIFPRGVPSNLRPGGITPLNGMLLFVAPDGTHGLEWWTTDGTESGTNLLKDVNARTTTSSFDLGDDATFVAAGNLTFFSAGTVKGQELWRTDGTTAGTFALAENVDTSELTNVNNVIYFVSDDGLNVPELWKTDGTVAGTVLVKSGFADGGLYGLVNFNGTLLFDANDGTHGFELWKSDGTESGTAMVKDIYPGSGSSFFANRVLTDDSLFFWANDGTHGTELWKTDGTEAGTVLVKDLQPGAAGASASLPVVVGSTLYFAADDGSHGSELWKSDGTESGTVLVADINPGTAASSPQNLVYANGALYFSANDGSHGAELWKSDGTEVGTALVKDIRAGSESSNIATLVNCAGTLFFVANDGTHGTELWKSDGTDAGTMLVKDISGPIGFPGAWAPLVPIGSTLFFIANDGTHGRELWKSDGSETGTVLVKDIGVDSASARTTFLANVNGTLYFDADNEDQFRELWTSDGSEAGTMRVESSPTEPNSLTNLNGVVYFVGLTDENGREPWIIAPPVTAQMFYHNSVFEQGVPGVDPTVDFALASDKVPYREGTGPATRDSVSSYSRGINGLFVDLAGEHGAISASDFTFKVGANNAPGSWADAPAPESVTVRPGEGVAGGDRVEIVWADGAIANTWLKIVVEGNDAAGGFNTNTGLDASEIFYFGNCIGDTFSFGPQAGFAVDMTDEIAVRNNQGQPAAPTNMFDFNRDAIVDATDQLIARHGWGALPTLDIAIATETDGTPSGDVDGGTLSAIASALPAPSVDVGSNAEMPQPTMRRIDRATIVHRSQSTPPAISGDFATPKHRASRQSSTVGFALDDELLDSLLVESRVRWRLGRGP